jgi:Xaa-Pro aminopeptidase
MVKSPAEIALIREGARIADLGGAAIRDAIRPGAREIDVAMAGRDAMEVEIARAFSRMPRSATPGSGSSQGPTPTARTTR